MALGFWGFSQKNRIFEQGSEPIELGAQGCNFVLIPKGLHNIAQGCHVFVATLGLDEIRTRTLKGFHRGKISTWRSRCGTLSGYNCLASCTQGKPWVHGLPWALLYNPLRGKDEITALRPSLNRFETLVELRI